MSTIDIAFIGSAGIPNRYGGFESFLEHCTPQLAQIEGRVIVTCDARLFNDRDRSFMGVERRFIGVPANGGLSPFHDLVAFLKTYREVDTVVVLGVSAGPFFPFMRFLAARHRTGLVVNIDGVEWRRRKFGVLKRALLRFFDHLAQANAHIVVYDNPALESFINTRSKSKARYIAYAGDHVKRLPTGGRKDDSALTICRIEPENNIEMLIEGALASGIPKYIVIGNWNASRYGRELRRRFQAERRLSMLDSIYDPELLAEVREACSIYLHGHSVGGTNPSLVEMMFYDAEILCFDCSFNRETAQERATYFGSAGQLAGQIDAARRMPRRTYPRRSEFTVHQVAQRYACIVREARTYAANGIKVP